MTVIRVEAMCMTCPNRLHRTDTDPTVAAAALDAGAHALGWRDDFPNGNWICDSCIAIAVEPIVVIAKDLTEALDGLLGTESDEPGFEEKWDRAEMSCRLAQHVFGMTKKEGTS